MPRFILIDRYSGFIFADTADLRGFDGSGGTPADAAELLDKQNHEAPRRYVETTRHDAERVYDVYRADIDGSEALPIVLDGQDPEAIAAVGRACRYVTSLRREPEEESAFG